MKKLGLLVLAFVVTFISHAQSPNNADALLNEVSTKVKGYDNILIDFKYTLENTSADVKHETRGDVSMQGEKYLLNFMGTTLIFDGKKLYTIVPENEEVNISSSNPEDDQNIIPSKMLTFYKDGYKSQIDKMVNLKGRKIQYVRLTPIDSNAEITNILLGIDNQTKHIYNLIQTQPNGTKITITVTGFKTNQPIPESLFQFKQDRYKDYYINRLD